MALWRLLERAANAFSVVYVQMKELTPPPLSALSLFLSTSRMQPALSSDHSRKAMIFGIFQPEKKILRHYSHLEGDIIWDLVGFKTWKEVQMSRMRAPPTPPPLTLRLLVTKRVEGL